MARRKLDGLTPLTGVWPEVFTGLDRPKTIKAGEKAVLPPEIAAILVKAGACRNG